MSSRRAAVRALLLLWLSACESAIARLRGRKVVAVTTLDRLPDGGAYRTKLGDDPIIVVNVRQEVRGFLAICTHEGCPLGWNPTQHLIRCPCHGSAFDTAGQVVNGPAARPLTPLQTFVERGRVLVVEPKRES